MSTNNVAEFKVKWQQNLTPNWTIYMPFAIDQERFFLAYDRTDGEVAIAAVTRQNDDPPDQVTISATWQSVTKNAPIPAELTTFQPFPGFPCFLASQENHATATLVKLERLGNRIDLFSTNLTIDPNTAAFMPFVFASQPYLLAYDDLQGKVTIYTIDLDDLSATPQSSIDWETGWTNFVPFVDQPYFLSYNRTSGTLRATQISQDTNTQQITFASREAPTWQPHMDGIATYAGVPNGPHTFFVAYTHTDDPQGYWLQYSSESLLLEYRKAAIWPANCAGLQPFAFDEADLNEYAVVYQVVSAVGASDPYSSVVIVNSPKPGYPIEP